MTDLFVLTADADMYAAMNQLLTNRQPSLGIRPIDFTVASYFKRDAGCRAHAAEL